MGEDGDVFVDGGAKEPRRERGIEFTKFDAMIDNDFHGLHIQQIGDHEVPHTVLSLSN